MRHMKQVNTIQGEGMTLSYLGHQNHFSTTENPLDFSGRKVMQRVQEEPKGMAQNKV